MGWGIFSNSPGTKGKPQDPPEITDLLPEAIALVGHEPHIGRLLGTLIADSRASVPMSPGMLAVVELEGSTSLWGRLVMARS